MKARFKSALKNTASAVKDVAVVGGGMILTKKFLDAKVLFAKQIEKDPKFADKFFVKHQGAVKLIGGSLAAGMVKNPLLKLLFVGAAIEGFISEARTLSTNKDGVALFESIGADSEIDAEMLEAASTVKGFGEDYGTMVSGETDLMNYTQSAVSGAFDNDYGTMVSGMD